MPRHPQVTESPGILMDLLLTLTLPLKLFCSAKADSDMPKGTGETGSFLIITLHVRHTGNLGEQ